MNIEDIQRRVEAFEAVMAAKGFTTPLAQFTVSAHADPHVYVLWKGVGNYRLFRGANAEDAFRAAHEWIDAEPTAAERHNREFLQGMSDLIAQGREIGIDDGWINPLVQIMQDLSENALTDQREKTK